MTLSEKIRPASFRMLIDRPSSLNRAGWFLLALAGLGALLWWALARPGDPLPQAPSAAASSAPVRVVAVRRETRPITLILPGVVQARQRGELSFLHAGFLAERRVARGQTVHTGDILAVLHNPALMPGAEAAQAEARRTQLDLDQLDREVRRLNDLHRRDLVPTEDLERIIARRDAAAQAHVQAEARLGEAREQLAEATLRAPYPATLGDWLLEPGEFAAAGQPVLVLSGSGELEVAVHLPIDWSVELAQGQAVAVRRRDRAELLDATIREIGTAAPGRPAEVVVALSDPDHAWQSGQPVELVFKLDSEPALSVPLSALSPGAGGHSRLFRIEQDRALAIEVTTGPVRQGWIEVRGALAAGDQVVVAGHGRLLDDDPVRILAH